MIIALGPNSTSGTRMDYVYIVLYYSAQGPNSKAGACMAYVYLQPNYESVM